MSFPGPHPGRLSRLRAALGRRGPAALLVSHLPNVRWLCGFSGTSGSLLVLPREAVLFSDFRYRAQARREAPGVRFVECAGRSAEAVAVAVRRARAARLGFEANRMTFAAHADLADALGGKGAELVPLRNTVDALRAVKEPGEIAMIQKGLAIAGEALVTAARGMVGRTEAAVAERLRVAIRGRGGEDEAFPTIVASGPRSALPHATPSARKVGGGDLVVIDFGVRYGGYCTDLTRTYSPFKWEKRSKEIYRLVLAAQRAALDAVAPGVKASEVDAAAREVIERAGHGKNFGHGTGHGVGLEIHELPTLALKSGDRLLAGMVVTIEPGIYIENFGGVRIEDMVLVTSSGREILSRRVPKLLDR